MTDKTVSIFDMFGVNNAEAEDGKWFELAPKVRVKVRRYKSKFSRSVRTRLEAPYKHLMRRGPLPQEIEEELAVKQLAHGIIADWEGFVDKQGQPLTYSPAQAEALLDALPELRDEIASLSLSLDGFRDETKDELKGN